MVFRAFDKQLGGVIAVKEIKKTDLPNRANFFDEARTMFGANCDHVAPIRCAFETKDLICLAMDYFDKGSLHELTSKGPLDLVSCIKLMQGILSGIGSIHAMGFIHFDIKPSNILISSRGEPMVADFGQTRVVGPGGVVMMPRMYPGGLPPEFFINGVGTTRSDIYQAGLTLYRMVNGDAFLKDQDPITDAEMARQTVSEKYPDRNRFMPHVPKSLRTVIRKALAVDPSDRFHTAADFVYALAGIQKPIDWQTKVSSNGEITWKGTPDGRAELELRLLADGKKWRTEAIKGTLGRKFAGDRLWMRGLTKSQAFGLLKSFFDEVE